MTVASTAVIPEEPVLSPDPAVVEAETPQLQPGTGETGDAPDTPVDVVEEAWLS